MLRLDPNETLDNQDSIILNSTLSDPRCVIEIPTKAYIDRLHEENERSRRDLGLSFYDEEVDLGTKNQNNDFNNIKITNVRSFQIIDRPANDNDAMYKKYLVDEIDSNTIVRVNDNSNDRYLQVQVNNIPYNLQIYNKTQILDSTKMMIPNTGHDLFQNWKIICNNRNGEGRPSDFIKSTKTNSPTGNSGATSWPPIGNAFVVVETTHNNYIKSNDNVFVSFERTDIIHISKFALYYYRFSISDPTK